MMYLCLRYLCICYANVTNAYDAFLYVSNLRTNLGTAKLQLPYLNLHQGMLSQFRNFEET